MLGFLKLFLLKFCVERNYLALKNTQQETYTT